MLLDAVASPQIRLGLKSISELWKIDCLVEMRGQTPGLLRLLPPRTWQALHASCSFCLSCILSYEVRRVRDPWGKADGFILQYFLRRRLAHLERSLRSLSSNALVDQTSKHCPSATLPHGHDLISEQYFKVHPDYYNHMGRFKLRALRRAKISDSKSRNFFRIRRGLWLLSNEKMAKEDDASSHEASNVADVFAPGHSSSVSSVTQLSDSTPVIEYGWSETSTSSDSIANGSVDKAESSEDPKASMADVQMQLDAMGINMHSLASQQSLSASPAQHVTPPSGSFVEETPMPSPRTIPRDDFEPDLQSPRKFSLLLPPPPTDSDSDEAQSQAPGCSEALMTSCCEPGGPSWLGNTTPVNSASKLVQPWSRKFSGDGLEVWAAPRR